MIKEFIIRTEDETSKVIKILHKTCNKLAKEYHADFYTKEIKDKRAGQLDLIKFPKGV